MHLVCRKITIKCQRREGTPLLRTREVSASYLGLETAYTDSVSRGAQSLHAHVKELFKLATWLERCGVLTAVLRHSSLVGYNHIDWRIAAVVSEEFTAVSVSQNKKRQTDRHGQPLNYASSTLKMDATRSSETTVYFYYITLHVAILSFIITTVRTSNHAKFGDYRRFVSTYLHPEGRKRKRPHYELHSVRTQKTTACMCSLYLNFCNYGCLHSVIQFTNSVTCLDRG